MEVMLRNELKEVSKGTSMHIRSQTLKQAVFFGDIGIVKTFFASVPTFSAEDNWYDWIRSVSMNGDLDILQFLVSRETNSKLLNLRTWNFGLKYAAEQGHSQIVEYFLEKGANNYGYALIRAVAGNQPTIIRILENKSTFTLREISDARKIANRNCYTEIDRYLEKILEKKMLLQHRESGTRTK